MKHYIKTIISVMFITLMSTIAKAGSTLKLIELNYQMDQ